MTNMRRRSGISFLATLLLCLCLYVLYHKNSFPYIPDDQTALDLSYHRHKQHVHPEPVEVALSTSLPAGHPFIKPNPEAITPPTERPLITYAYYETDFARRNLQFFLAHALHDAADFVFILNGDTDAEKLIFNDPYADVPTDIRHLFPRPILSNVFVKKRSNTCFDLGAHAEVLQSVIGEDAGWLGVDGPITAPIVQDGEVQTRSLRYRYSRFILLNASIRGPFFPQWSGSCWSDVYLNRLTQRIKLVGMSYNCHFGNGHVQSMIWATDKKGLDLMLTKEGMGECFTEIVRAMEAEVRMTKLFRDNNYEVDAFLSNYHQMDKEAKWERMRARMNARIEMAKREGEPAPAAEAEQEGIRVREATTNSQAYPYEGPTKEEEARMIAGLHMEPEKAEQWWPYPKERMPLFPKAKRSSSSEETRGEVETRSPPMVDESHHPYADISAQTQNYTDKLLTDTLDEPGYFWRECHDEDWLGRGSYADSFVHPFENLFMKSHRGIADTLLGNLTIWADGAGTNSWDVCR